MTTRSLAIVRQRYAEDGGAERFVARLLHALPDDVRVTLVTREWRASSGFDVMAVNPFYLGRLWRDRSFARAVCEGLGARSFDIVQSHERIACCDIYRAGDGVHREWLLQRGRVLGAFGQLMLHINPYHVYVKRAERRLFLSPQLRAVVCNSRMVKDEIKRYFELPEERLHVIYSGVDTDTFHPSLVRFRADVRARYGVGETTPLFLFVGSGFERKGLAAAIDALSRVPAAHLLVVGRDKHEARYRQRAQALGVAARVHFAGKQSDVKPYYGAADAFILPTLYDPFPNVALEAFASGLPLITSKKCGAAELIKDGENGFVCDAPNIPALAAAVRQLTLDAPRARMREAARRTGENFTLGRMTEQYMNLYRSCFGASNREAALVPAS